jgi:hypothetical protein
VRVDAQTARASARLGGIRATQQRCDHAGALSARKGYAALGGRALRAGMNRPNMVWGLMVRHGGLGMPKGLV